VSEPISCVIADDHPAMLTAIADTLEASGVDIVGRASDGLEALTQIEAKQPCIALVDVRMPRLSGIEVAQKAAVVAPNTSIVFYTAYGDRALLSEALDVGARGFVLKEAPLPDLVRAVERVAAGEAYVDPNEEIGKRLFISPETVRTHLRKAMAKLEADTRTQAVATALRQSLIS
jgi:DNA-binding NarL/FixJ family response regulator